jgi:hypothetical protein
MKILARTVSITPDNEVYLGGNSESVISNAIDSELEANLLIVKEYNSTKLIITMDLLYIGETITEAIKKFASGFVSAECLWISSSHCHNAPHVDFKKPKLGQVDPGYVNLVIDRINNELSRMVLDLGICENATTKLKASYAPLTINRRRKRFLSVTKYGLLKNKVSMQPNKKGKIDPLMRKLEFLNDRDEIIAVLWQYTCHPTSFHDPRSITSHFVGDIRKEMRIRSKSNIPILFLQGFAGDIRPPSSRRFHEDIIHNLLQGYQFRDFTKKEYHRWVGRLTQSFFSDYEIAGSAKYSHKSPFKKTWDSSKFVSKSPSSTVTLQIMPLGPICMIGLSCEPTVALTEELVKFSEVGEIWPCGYLEDVYGYLPSSEEIQSGGYEVDGFCESFDCGKLTSEGWNIAYREIRNYLNI